ncbi:MAG: hypothetical protein HY332_07480 [Chloroflexi bacterium]|nr:hypothetical protein [Chloroflexota bacterium]
MFCLRRSGRAGTSRTRVAWRAALFTGALAAGLLPGEIPTAGWRSTAVVPAHAIGEHEAGETALLIRAAAGGIALVTGHCSPQLSVLYQPGVEAIAGDFVQSALDAYARLATEAGFLPARRFRVLVFRDAAERRRAFAALLDRPEWAHGMPAGGFAAPGFERDGTVWIDAAAARHRTREGRAATVTHELTHAFVEVLAAARPVPRWLDEGLATYLESLGGRAAGQDGRATSGVTRPATWVSWEAVLRRGSVLDAVTGNGAYDLFSLRRIETEAAWAANYGDPGKQRLQYAQAHATVTWLEERYGLSSIWQAIRAIGRSGDADGVFTAVFGLSIEALEQATRETWSASATQTPSPVQAKVTIAPTTGAETTLVGVYTRIGGVTRLASAAGIAPGAYAFHVRPDGTVSIVGASGAAGTAGTHGTGGTTAEAEGAIALQSRSVADVPLLRTDGLLIVVHDQPARPHEHDGNEGHAAQRIGRPALDAGTAIATYTLSYGHWAPVPGGRAFLPDGADAPVVLSDDAGSFFPNGATIVVTAPTAD